MKVDFTGNPVTEKLNIDSGVGDITVMFGETWENNLAVDLDSGVGDTKLVLPVNTGVKVKVDTGIGSLKKGDFKKAEGGYVNTAYDESQNTITVDCDMGIGSITLKSSS